MAAIGDIIDHHHFTDQRAQGCLPGDVNAVMVNDQPVDILLMPQDLGRPGNVRRYIEGKGNIWSRILLHWNAEHGITGGLDIGGDVPGEITAYERDRTPALAQCGCQGEAAHDVTGTDVH
ncbi:hypothetical protein GMPD_39850 [Geomonas paludis]|uniref:Uncharacterized protein n=1 Tax=Geomonas paludis TaxID=2740185 RepID=A0A6V8N0L7_9BACT|nr:hypothetical protein GMPD_39850 [Geomonas paludis]